VSNTKWPEPIIFYDIESDSQYAPYTNLKMIGYQIGMEGEPKLLDLNGGGGGGGDDLTTDEFRDILASPEWTKVDFNGVNFDQIVLRRHGFPVHPVGRHDVFLMAKTVSPMLPAYGLKFLNWYFYGDPHEPERALHAWMQHRSCEDMYQVPEKYLGPYCLYDVVQTVRLFKLFWPIVRQPDHWRAYNELELGMGEVLHEIILEGGDCVNIQDIKRKIKAVEETVKDLRQSAIQASDGRVQNIASGKQVARELVDTEGFLLEVTDKGNFILRKDEILTLLDLDNPNNDTSRIARLLYEVREANNQLGFLRSYRKAALYELRLCAARALYRERGYVKIPKSYSLSAARTRRILSNSRFKINFQNQNKIGKSIQRVPPGWLGVWIDSTQIENVVHMWATNDHERIRAYKKDSDWSEYVWLCNRILGGDRSREELDGIKSNANPSWSVYKQFKTCKLALNFGMGIGKFSQTNRIDDKAARGIFDQIHKACPAIRGLQRKIAHELSKKGYVSDPFGHIYTGDPDMAYKIVAYFIQGCGTGSVPKAMARAIWEELRNIPRLRDGELEFDTCQNETTRAVMTTLTHDEIGFRLSLDLPRSTILSTLRKCLECMEQRFSGLFGMPLRAKLSLSTTTAAEAKVINHYHLTPQEWDQTIINNYLIYNE
jgi:DNA polymerase I-like protein with 3'-5' exonuclease and polymerase domains